MCRPMQQTDKDKFTYLWGRPIEDYEIPPLFFEKRTFRNYTIQQTHIKFRWHNFLSDMCDFIIKYS